MWVYAVMTAYQDAKYSPEGYDYVQLYQIFENEDTAMKMAKILHKASKRSIDFPGAWVEARKVK